MNLRDFKDRVSENDKKRKSPYIARVLSTIWVARTDHVVPHVFAICSLTLLICHHRHIHLAAENGIKGILQHSAA
jgi:hypothetical protein